jgi:hypothetical protein
LGVAEACLFARRADLLPAGVSTVPNSPNFAFFTASFSISDSLFFSGLFGVISQDSGIDSEALIRAAFDVSFGFIFTVVRLMTTKNPTRPIYDEREMKNGRKRTVSNAGSISSNNTIDASKSAQSTLEI